MIEKLPNEILHNIFMEIDSAECWCNLKLVSQKFKDVIESKLFWIHKLSNLTDNNNNNNINDKNVNQMVQECIAAETELKTWKSRKNGIGFASNAEPLEPYAFVECCEIILCDFGYLLFVGSRDKSIRAWNLKDLKIPFLQKDDAHSSWIKNLVGLPNNQLLSFGYDGSITLWKIQYQTLEKLSTVSLKSTVLDYAINSSNVYALSADNNIRMICFSSDALEIKWTEKSFKSQISAITCNQNTKDTVVYYADKNGTIISLDSKNWKNIDSLKLEDSVISMKYVSNELYCGTNDGDLIILSPTLKVIKKIQVLSIRISVNQIIGNLTCIICISNGGSVVVLERKTMKEMFRGSLSQYIITAQSYSNHFAFISKNGTISILPNISKSEDLPEEINSY